MKLKKLVLLDNGFKGIKIVVNEKHQKENDITVIDDVVRTRKVPVPQALRSKILKLKYFYLILTGHVDQGWADVIDGETLPDKKFSKSAELEIVQLWDNTHIDGFSISSNGFDITGSIMTVYGKYIKVSTPHITEGDDFGHYDRVLDIIGEIANEMTDYFANATLQISAPKQYLLNFVGNDEQEIARVESMSDEDLEDEMIRKLEEKGHVVFGKDEMIGIGEGEEVEEEDDRLEKEPLPEPTDEVLEAKETGSNPGASPEPKMEVVRETEEAMPAVATSDEL